MSLRVAMAKRSAIGRPVVLLTWAVPGSQFVVPKCSNRWLGRGKLSHQFWKLDLHVRSHAVPLGEVDNASRDRCGLR